MGIKIRDSIGYIALSAALSVSGCGGSTRADLESTGRANGREPKDGGEEPVEDDAAGGADPGDVDIPPLNFADIGSPVLVSKQFLFTEGPVWDAARGNLFFSDIAGDAIYRFTPPDQFEVALSKAGRPNGLALDPDGHLLVAGFAARSVWSFDDGSTLIDNYGGLKLNGPDDLAVRSDKTIYFTDPTYGIDGTNGPAAPQELNFMGVFRLAPDGTLFAEEQTSDSPNGVNLAPDEHTLYVSYTSASLVGAFDVASDGSLANKRTFADNLSIPDGMTVDRGGNLYVAVLRGIAVIAPSGALLGTIAVPQWASNCAFGGPDQKTLYITARDLGSSGKGGALYRIDDMPIAGIMGQP